MTFTVTYDPIVDCIQVVVHGELNLAVLQSIAGEVAKITQGTGCKHVLNDLRAAQPTDHTLDIYHMPQTAQQAGVSLFCKRALVVGDRAREFRFLETVFVNQGHQVKMFANLEDARAWLLSTPQGAPQQK